MNLLDLYTFVMYAVLGALVVLLAWEYIRLHTLTRRLRRQNDRDLNA